MHHGPFQGRSRLRFARPSRRAASIADNRCASPRSAGRRLSVAAAPAARTLLRARSTSILRWSRPPLPATAGHRHETAHAQEKSSLWLRHLELFSIATGARPKKRAGKPRPAAQKTAAKAAQRPAKPAAPLAPAPPNGQVPRIPHAHRRPNRPAPGCARFIPPVRVPAGS